GSSERAMTLARGITEWWERVDALAVVAEALDARGQQEEARELLSEAERDLSALDEPGQQEEAREILWEAERHFSSVDTPEAREFRWQIHREHALGVVSRTLAVVGDQNHAVALAGRMRDPRDEVLVRATPVRVIDLLEGQQWDR